MLLLVGIVCYGGFWVCVWLCEFGFGCWLLVSSGVLLVDDVVFVACWIWLLLWAVWFGFLCCLCWFGD